MNVAAELLKKSFTTVLYDSVVGTISIENEILPDGTIYTTLWVTYPDGMSTEVQSIKDACDILEV